MNSEAKNEVYIHWEDLFSLMEDASKLGKSHKLRMTLLITTAAGLCCGAQHDGDDKSLADSKQYFTDLFESAFDDGVKKRVLWGSGLTQSINLNPTDKPRTRIILPGEDFPEEGQHLK